MSTQFWDMSGRIPSKATALSNQSKKVKESLDKDTFGAATARVIIRVVLVYIIIWVFQRMAGNP